jgi:predicted RNase H-like nuclease (RuvC/YqgF family)
MNSKQTLNKVKTLLGLEVKLEQMKLENGVILEAEVFEAGNEIFIVNEEERVALPVGEYTLENGMMLIVSEEGIIGEIKEASVEEEAPVEEVVEEQEMATETQPKKVVESVSKEMFFSEIENLKKEIEALKAEKQELSKEEVKEEVKEVELSEQTQNNEPLKHNPEAQTENKNQFLFSQKRVQTTRDRVFNKLFN